METDGYNRKDPEEMRELGFIIDDHVYPWVAYKGSRFNPSEWYYCFTDLESELMWQLEQLQDKWQPIEEIDKKY